MSVPNLSFSISSLRKMVYETDVTVLDPSVLLFWNKPITAELEVLLDNVFKLSCLGKRIEQYPQPAAFFTAYNEKHQVIRAYVKHQYIVLEVNKTPEDYSSWVHIFEHHTPYDKSDKNFYKFKLPPNINDDIIDKLASITSMIVETVEHYVLDLINNKTTSLEVLHKIRILDKTESEIIDEEKIRFQTRKQLEIEEKKIKKDKSFFSNFKFGNKVIFS